MQVLNVQTNDVPKTASKVIILTKEDFSSPIKNGIIEEPDFDMVSKHDFNLTWEDIKSASYIMYISSTNRIKYLKTKHPILQ